MKNQDLENWEDAKTQVASVYRTMSDQVNKEWQEASPDARAFIALELTDLTCSVVAAITKGKTNAQGVK